MSKKTKKIKVQALINFSHQESPTGRRMIGEVFEVSQEEMDSLNNRLEFPIVKKLSNELETEESRVLET